MELSDAQREHLIDLGNEILAALERISGLAANVLRTHGSPNPAVSLAAPGNPMTGGGREIGTLRATLTQNQDQVRRILNEPFVARMIVKWEDGDLETLFVTKGSAAVLGRLPELKLATYASPLGRLAEFPAGTGSTLYLRGHSQDFEIVERTLLRPKRGEVWDATVDKFEQYRWQVALESLRSFLYQGGPPPTDEELDILAQIRAEEEGKESERATARHRVVERMALRDQPTLDQFQGDVFRMPLDRNVLLVGPPGSGKTTTLIHRLASKRNPEGLTEEESSTLSRYGLESRFREPDSWVMFSPTELLQLYLRDAFNHEQVPATNMNLRTWERERRELARNVFGILRVSADSNGFELDEKVQTLRGTTSDEISILYDRFVEFFDTSVLESVNQAFDSLGRAGDPGTVAAAARLRKVVSLR